MVIQYERQRKRVDHSLASAALRLVSAMQPLWRVDSVHLPLPTWKSDEAVPPRTVPSGPLAVCTVAHIEVRAGTGGDSDSDGVIAGSQIRDDLRQFVGFQRNVRHLAARLQLLDVGDPGLERRRVVGQYAGPDGARPMRCVRSGPAAPFAEACAPPPAHVDLAGGRQRRRCGGLANCYAAANRRQSRSEQRQSASANWAAYPGPTASVRPSSTSQPPTPPRREPEILGRPRRRTGCAHAEDADCV